jgi:hypothetical protein
MPDDSRTKDDSLDDLFASAAKKFGFGGFFSEETLPRPFDRPLTRQRFRLESYLLSLKKVHSGRSGLDVAVAYADSPEFNAFAFAVGNQHFIGIPYGTYLLLSDLFLRILAERTTFVGIGDPNGHLEQSKHAQLPLSANDLPISAANPLGSAVGPPDAVRQAYADYLTGIAFDFLFAHEYQHIEGGHLKWLHEQDAGALVEFAAPRLRPQEALDRQVLELDADAAATRWSLKIAVDRSNDHWRVPESLRASLRSDDDRVAAWLFAVYALFRYMEEVGGLPTDLGATAHPRSLMRHYFTIPAASYILGGLPCRERLHDLMGKAISEVESAFAKIVSTPPPSPDPRMVLQHDFAAHISRLVRHWPTVRSKIGPIAVEWGGSNAPDEYFESIAVG